METVEHAQCSVSCGRSGDGKYMGRQSSFMLDLKKTFVKGNLPRNLLLINKPLLSFRFDGKSFVVQIEGLWEKHKCH